MNNFSPLADRMRPQSLDEFIGQSHLLGADKPLYNAIRQGALHSMLFWGPPGCGKTTIARLIGQKTQAKFINLSAVLSGVKDIRESVKQAQINLQKNLKTILFIDEIHRFNKSQQDAFLPYVESGLFYLIGATTENPSFELNNALLSRVRIYVLKALKQDDIKKIIVQALKAPRGLLDKKITIDSAALDFLIQSSNGDGRVALNLLEISSDLIENNQAIDLKTLQHLQQHSLKNFDKGSDIFYEQISALHKSVRGSDPDAALYWLIRMIDGGCDPLYIIRRVIRMATEDIGNADPRALHLALNAHRVYKILGSPEGELAIAAAIIYISCAAKSNAVYMAYKKACNFVKNSADLPVPLHLRNAPTKLMGDLGYGKKYRYDHDEVNAYSTGQTYLPDGLSPVKFYNPVNRGLEIKIKEKLKKLEALCNNSDKKQ